MATFADEAGVRLRFQLNDTTLAPSVLIARSLADAHDEILRHVDASLVAEPAQDGLVLGETLLAGAYVLRALASKDAQDQKQVTIGGQRIESGKRFASLMALAELAERSAWLALARFVVPVGMRVPAAATDTVAVFGEE